MRSPLFLNGWRGEPFKERIESAPSFRPLSIRKSLSPNVPYTNSRMMNRRRARARSLSLSGNVVCCARNKAYSVPRSRCGAGGGRRTSAAREHQSLRRLVVVSPPMAVACGGGKTAAADTNNEGDGSAGSWASWTSRRRRYEQ